MASRAGSTFAGRTTRSSSPPQPAISRRRRLAGRAHSRDRQGRARRRGHPPAPADGPAGSRHGGHAGRAHGHRGDQRGRRRREPAPEGRGRACARRRRSPCRPRRRSCASAGRTRPCCSRSLPRTDRLEPAGGAQQRTCCTRRGSHSGNARDPARARRWRERCLAWSSAGQTLASGSGDATIRLWDARTHKQSGAALEGHTGSVAAVALSPDGRTLASRRRRSVGPALGRAYGDAAPLAPARSHRRRRRACVQPRRAYAGVGHFDGTILLWDVRTHKRRGAALRSGDDGFYDVAFSPDGRTLAAAADDTRLWDVTVHAATDPDRSRQLRPRRRVQPGRAHAGLGRRRRHDPRVEPARAPRRVATPTHEPASRSPGPRPDGRGWRPPAAIKTRLWDPRTRRKLGATLIGHAGA